MPVHLDHIGPAARGGARSKGSLQKLGRWKISARRILVEKEAGREVDAQSHCHGRQQRIKLCRILCTAGTALSVPRANVVVTRCIVGASKDIAPATHGAAAPF